MCFCSIESIVLLNNFLCMHACDSGISREVAPTQIPLMGIKNHKKWRALASLLHGSTQLHGFFILFVKNLDTTFLKSRLIGRSRRHVSDVCQFITELCIWRCQSSGQRSHLFESSSSIFSWDKWQYPPPLLVHNEWTFPSPSNIWKGWSKFLELVPQLMHLFLNQSSV